mgnify:CR=1 FL=1
MKVYFKLFSRDLKSSKKALRVRVYHKHKNVVKDKSVGTGLSIIPKFWDKDAERVTDMHPNQRDINERIAEIKANREDLLNQYDSGKISYESVLNQIIDKSSDDTIDDFIESKCKPPIKSDSVYKNLKNQLGGFKKLIGHRGKISWSDINNETIYNAYNIATRRQKEGSLSARSYKNYIGAVKQLVDLGRFLGVTKLTLDIPESYTHLDEVKDKSYHITKNEGNTTEEVVKAIEDIKTIQQWQAVAMWLLSFCLRGFYYADIVSLKQEDIKDKDDNKIGHLLSTFAKDDIHIYHRRSKGYFPMYIKLFNYPVMGLINRLKFVTAYTHNDRRFKGKSILGDINDQIAIFDYDHKSDSTYHNEMTKHIQRKLKKKGLMFKKARKSFNQYAQKLRLNQDVRQVLLGHKEGGKTIRKHYDSHTLTELLDEVDRMHYEVLKEFKVEELYDRLLVKLKYLVAEDNLPKWILSFGAVKKEGRKLSILTGFQNKEDDFRKFYEGLEWVEIQDKYRAYFIKDKRADKDYWKDLEKVGNVDKSELIQKILKDISSKEDEIKQAETKVIKLKSA